jgi:hypothetical protein
MRRGLRRALLRSGDWLIGGAGVCKMKIRAFVYTNGARSGFRRFGSVIVKML